MKLARDKPAGAASSQTWRVRLLVIATVFVAVLGTFTIAAPMASATTVTSNVNLRPCVNLANPNCSPVGTTGTSGISKMRCWRDGSWATGYYSSNRWFLIVLNDGREGYVHSSFVGGQYATPACTTLPYVRAADFAIGLIGQYRAPEPYASYYALSDWAPGPYAEWSGDCAKLTHMSFRYGAGVSYAVGNAINQYYTYRNAGMIYGGLPRYGDPVFYNIAAPYGHTAIYIGGTTIVSTQGMDFANLPVARRDIYSFGAYLGWARVG
jgi:hypothetical protein